MVESCSLLITASGASLQSNSAKEATPAQCGKLYSSFSTIGSKGNNAERNMHDRTPTHEYDPTREAAMAAFAKSWRRE